MSPPTTTAITHRVALLTSKWCISLLALTVYSFAINPPDSLFWVKQRRMLLHDRLDQFEIKKIHSFYEFSPSRSLFCFSISYVNIGPSPLTLDAAGARRLGAYWCAMLPQRCLKLKHLFKSLRTFHRLLTLN